MKIVRIEDLKGTEREVTSPAGWTSIRFLLKKEGMGFSMHETVFPAGLEVKMWYKHHLEAVYCYQGAGVITDLENDQQHEIKPGTLDALDNHDRHILKGAHRAQTRMRLQPARHRPGNSRSGRRIRPASR